MGPKTEIPGLKTGMVHVIKFQTLYSILFWSKFCFLCSFFLKILSGITGMANSVDPDQTVPEGAVRSGYALFAYAILLDTLVYKTLGQLPQGIN